MTERPRFSLAGKVALLVGVHVGDHRGPWRRSSPGACRDPLAVLAAGLLAGP